MPSSLLALARGAAEGFGQRQEDARQKNREDLALALELADRQGISLEDPTAAAATAPPAAPGIPDIPGTPGSAQSHSAVMQAAHDAFNRTPVGKIGEPVVPAAPAAATTTPATPRNLMKIASVSINGQPKNVMLDPTQTAGGKRRAAEKANQAAFDRLNVGGAMGAYEPTFDYVGKERSDIDEQTTVGELVASGVDPAEAKLLAKNKIDVNLRRDRQATLDERIRHDKAMEARANARGTTQAKQELNSVNTQISANRQDLTGAKKAATALGDSTISTLYNLDPQAYRDSLANSTGRVSSLQQRADSLRNVGDSLSAIVQGRTKAPAKNTAPAGSGSATGNKGKKVKLSPGTTVTNDDLDAALDANGGDVKKARAWLTTQGKK